jgi:ribosome-binding factor A
MRSRFRTRPSARQGRREEGAELPPRDDADVELFFGDRSRRPAPAAAQRKSRQLCREVERVLVETLAADLDDPLLALAMIVEVVPAPDASRLAVRLRLSAPHDAHEVRARLERAKGLLRGEVALALQRKRTPDLVFEVVP